MALRVPGQLQPAANLPRKQVKSLTLRTGATALASQLAYWLPAAKLARKQVKSPTLRMGWMVELSQLG